MSNESKVARMVHETHDYSLFRTLEGNRAVLDIRKKRVHDSVEAAGQIPIPIVVNEKFEIIDGQARFEVFRELDLPIYYIQIDGLSVKECMALNAAQTNWTVQDYIESGCAKGNRSYELLKKLVDTHKAIPVTTVISITSGTYGGYGSSKKDSRFSVAAIKSGRFSITSEEAYRVDNVLTFIDKMLAIGSGNGSNSTFALAVSFIYAYSGDEDQERLLVKWERYSSAKFANARYATIPECLAIMSQVFNQRSRAEDVRYFENEYDKYCRAANAAYAKRWGEESGRRKTHKSA